MKMMSNLTEGYKQIEAACDLNHIMIDLYEINESHNFISIMIEDGDWKHDHWRFKSIVSDMYDNIIKINTVEMDESEDDCYSAIHTIYFKPVENTVEPITTAFWDEAVKKMLYAMNSENIPTKAIKNLVNSILDDFNNCEDESEEVLLEAADSKRTYEPTGPRTEKQNYPRTRENRDLYRKLGGSFVYIPSVGKDSIAEIVEFPKHGGSSNDGFKLAKTNEILSLTDYLRKFGFKAWDRYVVRFATKPDISLEYVKRAGVYETINEYADVLNMEN